MVMIGRQPYGNSVYGCPYCRFSMVVHKGIALSNGSRAHAEVVNHIKTAHTAKLAAGICN
jgi:hypothetical protein